MFQREERTKATEERISMGKKLTETWANCRLMYPVAILFAVSLRPV